MSKRNHTHIQVVLPEIKAMLAEGKAQREVASYYRFIFNYIGYPVLQLIALIALAIKPKQR